MILNLIIGNLKMKFLSALLFCLILVSGYNWYLFGLREKDSKVYFIENRYPAYENYSELELKRELEIESQKDKENELKMDIAAIVFVVCTAGLVLETGIILITMRPMKR